MTPDASELPKYLQLSEMLVREVAAGRLRVGDRLPPERQMAAELGVAVGTLRKALAKLAEDGVIERQHGSGNYIRAASQARAIYALFRLERIDGGGLPRARVLSVARMAKPDGLPAFGASGEAHRIRRLRLLDDTVVAAEEIWLDGACAERVSAADLSESLYLYYRERLGLWIAAIEDRVGVGAMPGWADETGLATGTACGHFARRSRTADGRTVEVSQTWFNHERARYVAREDARGGTPAPDAGGAAAAVAQMAGRDA